MSNGFSLREGYEVRLAAFEGPLDLLLHLIEREKLDISTISLAQVTDQFLQHIQNAETLLPGTLADFLAMAARLVWLKSRLLLPQPPKASDAEEEDPGEELARQLREYKRFKQVAQTLHEVAASGHRGFVRVAIAPEFERQLRRCDVSLEEFLAAVGRALSAKQPPPVVGTVVTPFTVTIHDQIHLIARLTAGGQSITFHSLLGRATNRIEIIVTLLAVLELSKRQRVLVQQSRVFGEITITPVAGAEIETGAEGDEAFFLPQDQGLTAVTDEIEE
jgi:segregation and condensation protein A